MPINDNLGANEFLTIQATSTKPISVKWYNKVPVSTNPLAPDFGIIDKNISPIPIGSVFTWTLPYELAQLTCTNGKLILPMLNTSFWLNSTMRQYVCGKDCRNCISIPVPFGLSIGTLSNPTAISNDIQFNNLPGNICCPPMPTQDGIIGGMFGTFNYTTSWIAPSEFSYTYSQNSLTYIKNTVFLSTYIYEDNILNKNTKID